MLTAYTFLLGVLSLSIFGNILFIQPQGHIYPTNFQCIVGLVLAVACLAFSIAGFFLGK
jgi:hypothetical protein